MPASTWARVPPRSTASSTPRAPHRTRRDMLLLFSPGRRLSVVDDFRARGWERMVKARGGRCRARLVLERGRRGYRRHRDRRGWDDSRSRVCRRRSSPRRKPDDGKAKRQTKGRADFPSLRRHRSGRGRPAAAGARGGDPRAPVTDAGAIEPAPWPTAAGEKPARVQVVVLGTSGLPRMASRAVARRSRRGRGRRRVRRQRTPPRGRRSSQHPHGPHPAPGRGGRRRVACPESSPRRSRRDADGADVDHRGASDHARGCRRRRAFPSPCWLCASSAEPSSSSTGTTSRPRSWR